MKIASFNIENLFARHRNLLLGNDKESELLVQDFDALVYKKNKSLKDFLRMRELWEVVGTNLVPKKSIDAFKEYEYHILSNIENLKGRHGIISIYNEMAKNPDLCPITFEDIGNKAKMILEVGADVLVLQEVEGQAAMEEFNRYFLNGLYEHIYFTPTRDTLGRGMGLMLRQGVKLCSIKSISAPPLFDVRSTPRGFIQWYKLQSKKTGSLELVNVHLISSQNSNYVQLTGEEMTAISEIINLNLNKKLTSFVLGSLNITSFSREFEAFIRPSSLVKLNDLSCFSSTLDSGSAKNYHSLGAYLQGINQKQLDYLLVSEKTVPQILETGLIRQRDLPSFYKKSEIEARPCLWLKLNNF